MSFLYPYNNFLYYPSLTFYVKVATLLSGGKDSIYATYISLQYGWQITSAVAMTPINHSWMFHGVNSHVIPIISRNMGLPLFQTITSGQKETELADLEILLSHKNIEGVISGAVASEYQRTRIEEICHRLSLKSFTPLWHKNQEQILWEMVHHGFKIIIVSVAAEGLGEEWLGRTIDKDCVNRCGIIFFPSNFHNNFTDNKYNSRHHER